MGEFPRKSDGRRFFTVEFKRGVVQQLLKGEKTLAEVSRELDIQPRRTRSLVWRAAWRSRSVASARARSYPDRCSRPPSRRPGVRLLDPLIIGDARTCSESYAIKVLFPVSASTAGKELRRQGAIVV